MNISESVISREDYLYFRSEKDFLSYYTNLQEILENLGFRLMQEPRMEWWTANPKLKPNVQATKEKDPYTDIVITVKPKLKKPLQHFKFASDTLKLQLQMSSSVEVEFPHETPFQRSIFYKGILKAFLALSYRKEIEKYKEEAEELTLEIANKARETYDSVPTIGKSKREYYSPSFR